MNSMFGYVKKVVLNPSNRIDTDLKIESDSDFIIEKVYAIYTNPFKLNIIDTLSNYNWFSNRIRSDCWFGTPQYPNLLSKPIEISRGSLLKFDIENLSTSTNTIEMVFEGYRIYDRIITLGKKRYFCYVKDFSLNPLDMFQDTILTNADTDFLIQKLYAYLDNDYSTDLKMSFTELGGKRITNEYVNVNNLFGSVLRPNILSHPVKIGKNSIIQFDLRNNLNSIENLQLILDGFKIWE